MKKKSAKEYAIENPKRNIQKKIRERILKKNQQIILERKSAKENPRGIFERKSP